MKGMEAATGEKQHFQSIATAISASDVHAMTKGAGAELLGFSGKDEEFEPRQRGPPRGGARGGRGGDRGGRGGDRGGRGGRRGGKPIFNANNEDDFPAL